MQSQAICNNLATKQLGPVPGSIATRFAPCVFIFREPMLLGSFDLHMRSAPWLELYDLFGMSSSYMLYGQGIPFPKELFTLVKLAVE